jgi:LCP family protein required for cell wall assembly
VGGTAFAYPPTKDTALVPTTAGRRHSPRARHAARTRPLKRVLTALGVTLALLAATGTASAFVAYYRLNNNITKQDVEGLLGTDRPEKVAEAAEDREAQNILLMGSDKRRGDAALNVEGERSDTTILLHLAADRESAVMVSIPRDSIVDIPECMREDGTTVPARSAQMFNSAFSEGGAACTIKTVEKLTDIRIDHHVVIDFNGFKGMVNALGGVKVCVPTDVNDPQSHLNLTAGTHTVKGQQALAYVRTRTGLGDGSDISRIDRQQAFLGSMVKKVRSTGLLLRPDRLLRFLDAATKSLTTDPELGSLNALRKLAQDVQGLDTKDVTFVTVPNEPYDLDPNRVQFKDSADALWDSLRFDQPLPGKEPKPSPSASPSVSGPPLVTPPENVSVTVLNGSGVAGEASRVAKELTAAGFNVVSVGNADRKDHTTTTVSHDPAYDESGRTLGAALPGSTVAEDLSLGSTLVVVVGADRPTAVTVEVTGSTSTPQPEETLETRSADDDICA